MKRNEQYERDMSDQVQGMLATASRRHPSFVDDCLSTNVRGRLAERWSDDVSIEFVDGPQSDPTTRDHDAGVAHSSSIMENTRHLSGLFTPPIGSQQALIRISYLSNDYPPRSNFTLLHEIGHLLQQTENELALRLARIDGLSADRTFEEEACDRFAAQALLPDSYLKQFFADGITAHALAAIYDDCRTHGRETRVSRPVIVRRVAALLGGASTATIIDDEGRLGVRVHGDGHCDYPPKDDTETTFLSSVEEDMLQRLHAAEIEGSANSFGLTEPESEQGTVTGAFSYAGPKRRFAFVVVAAPDGIDMSSGVGVSDDLADAAD